MKGKKEKIIGGAGSITGIASIMGSFQVCHTVCLSIASVLSLIGITIVGMPLAFFTRVALPFWITAVVLFLIALGFYFRKGCISKNLLIFNSGILIIGTPFQSLQNFSKFFWITGIILIIISVILFLKNKFGRKK